MATISDDPGEVFEVSFKHALFVVLLLVSTNLLAADPIDWNGKELHWLSYEEGIEALAKNKGNALFIIYADWCPTCKEYSQLFKRPDVVQALKGLTLIRANKDERPDISQRFSLDGEYVPRTFALDHQGRVITDLNSQNPRWWYFIPSDEPDYLIALAKTLLARQAEKDRI